MFNSLEIVSDQILRIFFETILIFFEFDPIFITEFTFDAFLKLDVGTRVQVSEPYKLVVHTYT